MYRQNRDALVAFPDLAMEILIHFAEHVGDSVVKGCIDELENMGAIVERKDERTVSVAVLRQKNYPFIMQFLEQEEHRGALRWRAGDRPD